MVDLSCDRCTELLGDEVEGNLDAGLRDALEEHLARCPACADLARGYREISEIVRRATDTEMPYEVEARLRRLLAASRRKDRD